MELFTKSFVKPIRLRICNVIKKWIEDYWEDFAEDRPLVDKLLNFVEQDIRIAIPQTGDTLSKSIYRKVSFRN